jgi:16S rRNA (uracil1498-N3)-methyltransferase
MQLFYLNTLNDSSTVFNFNKDESRHIVKVLRKSNGDILHITNGKGWLFEAEILDNNIKSVQAKIVKKELHEKLPYELHIAIAPTKNMDRLEWFMEKATEIGISEITPIICDNSERRVVKMERLERIVQSAVKQSLRTYMPVIHEAVGFNDLIARTSEAQKFIAHCVPDDKQSLKNSIIPGKNVMILIGPEGDFSVNEIQIALKAGFIPVTLGQTRLRTETAALAACHTVAFINE